MLHSTVTKRGQTTIPSEIRKALQIKPGDTLEYEIDRTASRFAFTGTKSLEGVLASDKGRGLSFGQIRQATTAKTNRGRPNE